MTEGIVTDESKTEMVTENNQYKVRDINVLDMQGVLVKMTGELGTTTYTAIWNSDTTMYELFSNVSEKEFNAILNTLKFLK